MNSVIPDALSTDSSTRLYVLVRDEESARQMLDALRDAAIDEDALSAVAHRKTYPLESLPEAGLLERTDIVPAALRGSAAGGATAVVAGLAASVTATPGLIVAGPLLLAKFAGAGAAFGTWASSLIGIGLVHRDLKPFEEALEDGGILLLVDVPSARAEQIEARIRSTGGDLVVAQGVLEDIEQDIDLDGDGAGEGARKDAGGAVGA